MSISDHHVVRYAIDVHRPAKKSTQIVKRNYRSFDADVFNADICSTCLTLSTAAPATNVNELVGSYTLSVLDKHAPERLTTVRRDKPKPWYNGDIDDARRRRRKAESVWRGTKLEVYRQIFVTARDECNDIITQAKTTFYRDKLQYADNKSIFQTVRSLSGKPAPSYLILTRSVSVLKHFQYTSMTRLLKCVPNYMVPTTNAIRHCVKHVGFSHQSSHSTPHV